MGHVRYRDHGQLGHTVMIFGLCLCTIITLELKRKRKKIKPNRTEGQKEEGEVK